MQKPTKAAKATKATKAKAPSTPSPVVQAGAVLPAATPVVALKQPKKATSLAKSLQHGYVPNAVAGVYVITSKVYNPKAAHNVTAWANVQAAIKAGNNTHAALCAVLSTHSAFSNLNHVDFIGYMVKGGHIQLTKAS
jgi:hypothetical protein